MSDAMLRELFHGPYDPAQYSPCHTSSSPSLSPDRDGAGRGQRPASPASAPVRNIHSPTRGPSAVPAGPRDRDRLEEDAAAPADAATSADATPPRAARHTEAMPPSAPRGPRRAPHAAAAAHREREDVDGAAREEADPDLAPPPVPQLRRTVSIHPASLALAQQLLREQAAPRPPSRHLLDGVTLDGAAGGVSPPAPALVRALVELGRIMETTEEHGAPRGVTMHPMWHWPHAARTDQERHQEQDGFVDDDEDAAVATLQDPRFFPQPQPFVVAAARLREEPAPCGITLEALEAVLPPSLFALAEGFRDPVTLEFVQQCPVHARLVGGALSEAVYDKSTLVQWVEERRTQAAASLTVASRHASLVVHEPLGQGDIDVGAAEGYCVQPASTWRTWQFVVTTFHALSAQTPTSSRNTTGRNTRTTGGSSALPVETRRMPGPGDVQAVSMDRRENLGSSDSSGQKRQRIA